MATHLVSDIGESNHFWEAFKSSEKGKWMEASSSECFKFIKKTLAKSIEITSQERREEDYKW